MSLDEWKLNFSKDGIKISKRIESPFDKQLKEVEIEKIGYDELMKKFDNKLNISVTKIEPRIENGILKSLIFNASEFKFLESLPQTSLIINDTSKVLIIGDKKIPWTKSNDLLIIPTRWLFENNRLQKKDMPIFVPSSKRYLLNSKPEHSYGRRFDSSEIISEGIYLHTNYNTSDCKRHGEYLMKKFAPDIEFKILGF